MDNLLCYSYVVQPTLVQHISDVREVLAILLQEKLFVKAAGREELGFLDHRVSGAVVSVDPRKVPAVLDW